MDIKRYERNELSRNKADQHQQRWDENELEILVEFWGDPEVTIEQIAAELGRTVEACRQRYYEFQRGQAASEKIKQVNQWTKGFTSLEDMGF
jgi:hypothetical protein